MQEVRKTGVGDKGAAKVCTLGGQRAGAVGVLRARLAVATVAAPPVAVQPAPPVSAGVAAPRPIEPQEVGQVVEIPVIPPRVGVVAGRRATPAVRASAALPRRSAHQARRRPVRTVPPKQARVVGRRFDRPVLACVVLVQAGYGAVAARARRAARLDGAGRADA